MTTTTTWTTAAACLDHDPDVWFPAPTGSHNPWRVARAVCLACPVRIPCLEAALAEEAGDGLIFGMRGGLTPSQRAAIRRSA